MANAADTIVSAAKQALRESQAERKRLEKYEQRLSRVLAEFGADGGAKTTKSWHGYNRKPESERYAVPAKAGTLRAAVLNALPMEAEVSAMSPAMTAADVADLLSCPLGSASGELFRLVKFGWAVRVNEARPYSYARVDR